jgi:hypothetical protein
MPITKPAHRFHRAALFGDGPRVPLDREQRAVWKFRVEAARRAGQITEAFAYVAHALARRLGADGRLDPSHAALARDAAVSERTVRRALAALSQLGLVRWVQRLVRSGWRVEQTSNAYALALPEFACPPKRKSFLRVSRPACPPQENPALQAMMRAASALPDLLAIRRAMWERRATGSGDADCRRS